MEHSTICIPTTFKLKLILICYVIWVSENMNYFKLHRTNLKFIFCNLK